MTAPATRSAVGAVFLRTRFAPAPTSQPVLPCALRHRAPPRRVGRRALGGARGSAGKPRFTHALEWLLFSALDRAADEPGETRRAERMISSSRESSGKKPIRADPIRARHRAALADAARLIREFPEFTDVVASVARKTDAEQWPALFAVAGDPEALQARAAAAGRLRVAACYLLVVEALKDARAGHRRGGCTARRRRGEDGLVGELTRFLVRPAAEAAAADVANSKPRCGAAVREGCCVGSSGRHPRNLRRRNRLKKNPFLFFFQTRTRCRRKEGEFPVRPARAARGACGRARRRDPAAPRAPLREALRGTPRRWRRRGTWGTSALFPARRASTWAVFFWISPRASRAAARRVWATSPRRWTSRRTRWRGTGRAGSRKRGGPAWGRSWNRRGGRGPRAREGRWWSRRLL